MLFLTHTARCFQNLRLPFSKGGNYSGFLGDGMDAPGVGECRNFDSYIDFEKKSLTLPKNPSRIYQYPMGICQNPTGTSKVRPGKHLNPTGIYKIRPGKLLNPTRISEIRLGKHINPTRIYQDPIRIYQDPIGIYQNRLGLYSSPPVYCLSTCRKFWRLHPCRGDP